MVGFKLGLSETRECPWESERQAVEYYDLLLQ